MTGRKTAARLFALLLALCLLPPGAALSSDEAPSPAEPVPLPVTDSGEPESSAPPQPLATPEPTAEPEDEPDDRQPDPFAAARILRSLVGLEDPPEGSCPGVYAAAALLGPGSIPAPTEPPVPTPVPTPLPTETPAPRTRAEALLADMTLEEKVWQLLIVRPSDLDPSCVKTVTAGMRSALGGCPVGGIILFAANMESKSQVRTLLADLQDASALPLLMMCDEEGGTVSRLMRTVGTTQIGPMLDYKDDGPDTAFENARTIGSDMAALGFNLDLAPVADVWSNPRNTVIGSRAYSDDFGQAAELIPAAVRGFHAGGVGCTLKHFPGHGDTTTDTHDGAAYVYKTLDGLRAGELLPFRAGIEAGADAVMIGHLTVTDVSAEPALFSYALVTELLRGELGFDGVVLTDALRMKALTDRYDTAEVSVRAVAAGVDMLLEPTDPAAAVEAILDAVERGELTEARIDESVLRVLTLKENRGLI